MEKQKNSYEYELAGVFERLLAITIDTIISGIIASALFLGSQGSLGFLGFVIVGAYNWYFWTRNDGQTPGKAIVGIRVIKADGTPISDVDAIMRYIGYHVSGFLFGLGYLWALWDPNRQTWHDKIANTYVVKKGQRVIREKRKTDEIYYDSTIV